MPPPASAAQVDRGAFARTATLAAVQLQKEAPDHCQRRRVAVSRLATELGIEVHTRHGLDVPARWHRSRTQPLIAPQLWDERPASRDIIYVRPGLRDSARRFAIAHEIGHVVLNRTLGGCGTDLPIPDQEHFANIFAAELLLPMDSLDEIRDQFRQSSDPAALLRVADSLGVSPQVLLRRAHTDNWLSGLSRIWVDIRSVPNRHTGRDRRPRIYKVVVDRASWFLPCNRSVTGAFGGDEWLSRAGRSLRTTGSLQISQRATSDGPRFHRSTVQVEVEALRLRRPGLTPGMEVLAHVDLAGEAS